MPFDKTLINILHSMVKEENKIKDYKRRIRIKGVVKAKGATKKGNITLKIKKEGDEYNFTVIKSHKESFALAEKLNIKWLSTGEILRQHVAGKTRQSMLEGKLVKDDTIEAIT